MGAAVEGESRGSFRIPSTTSRISHQMAGPVADVEEIHFVGAKGLRCIGAYRTGWSGDEFDKDVNDIGWITQRAVIGEKDLEWPEGPMGRREWGIHYVHSMHMGLVSWLTLCA